MTVTIGRRELLVALGGVARAQQSDGCGASACSTQLRDDPEKQSGVAVFLQVLPIVSGERTT
jgi:hypothetical protein